MHNERKNSDISTTHPAKQDDNIKQSESILFAIADAMLKDYPTSGKKKYTATLEKLREDFKATPVNTESVKAFVTKLNDQYQEWTKKESTDWLRRKVVHDAKLLNQNRSNHHTARMCAIILDQISHDHIVPDLKYTNQAVERTTTSNIPLYPHLEKALSRLTELKLAENKTDLKESKQEHPPKLAEPEKKAPPTIKEDEKETQYKYKLTSKELKKSNNMYIKAQFLSKDKQSKDKICYQRDMTNPMPQLHQDFIRDIKINHKSKFDYKHDGKFESFKKIIEELFSEKEIKLLNQNYSQGTFLLAGAPFISATFVNNKTSDFVISQPKEGRYSDLYKQDGEVFLKTLAFKYPVSYLDDPVGYLESPVEVLFKLTEDGFELVHIATNSALFRDIYLGYVEEKRVLIESKHPHALEEIEKKLDAHCLKLNEYVENKESHSKDSKFVNVYRAKEMISLYRDGAIKGEELMTTLKNLIENTAKIPHISVIAQLKQTVGATPAPSTTYVLLQGVYDHLHELGLDYAVERKAATPAASTPPSHTQPAAAAAAAAAAIAAADTTTAAKPATTTSATTTTATAPAAPTLAATPEFFKNSPSPKPDQTTADQAEKKDKDQTKPSTAPPDTHGPRSGS